MSEILRLKEVLTETGVSIKELSEKVGMTYGYIGALVRHEKYPKLDTLVDIAKALNVDIRTLLVPTIETQDELTDSQILDEIIRLVQDLKNKK